MIGGGDADPFDPTHLFGEFAAEMQKSNGLTRNGLIGLHARLVKFFSELGEAKRMIDLSD